MVKPNIIIPRIHRSGSGFTIQDQIVEEAARQDMIPLRILCPPKRGGCGEIFKLFIKSFDQGLYCLLGQACPYCKRFIKESDDPNEILVDAKEMREMMGKDNKKRRG